MWIEASSGETATPITPSDSTPVALAANTAVKPTESGYAIKSSPASVTPNDDTRVYLTKDAIIKPTESGYAMKSFPFAITPDNANPVYLTKNTNVRLKDYGYAIQSYRDITPSDDFPTTFYINQICRFKETGNVIKSFPENIIPSDTSPETLISGKIYKMDGGGHAIKSFSYATPATPPTSGTYFPSGFVKMESSGYAYSRIPAIGFGSVANDETTASASHVMNVTKDSYYVLLVYMNSSSSQLAYNRYDNANITGNNNNILSTTLMGNLTDTNAYVVGSFFKVLTSTSTAITITTTNNSRVALFRTRLI